MGRSVRSEDSLLDAPKERGAAACFIGLGVNESHDTNKNVII